MLTDTKLTGPTPTEPARRPAPCKSLKPSLSSGFLLRHSLFFSSFSSSILFRLLESTIVTNRTRTETVLSSFCFAEGRCVNRR